MLSLHDDGHVDVSEGLLSLIFNLQIRTMYSEYEMYYADGEVYETMLVQKTKIEVGFMWILGLGSFKVIGLSESQIQASIVILTNKSSTSTVLIFFLLPVELDSTDENMFVLLDSKDDICASDNLSNTLPFPFKSVHSTPSQLPIHVAKSAQGLYGNDGSPNLTFLVSSTTPFTVIYRLAMVDALKLTKSRKKSKSDLASIDFDNIDVREVKF